MDTSPEAFDRAFLPCLDRFADAVLAALRVIVATPVSETIGVLDFEIQPSWDDFPVYVIGMAADAPDEVWCDPPFVGAVLEDAGPLVPDGWIDREAFEAAGVATYARGARLLAEWFGACWHRAGGAEFPVKVVIHLADATEFFDLRARRWVTPADVWPGA